jgi:hypothetical protein
MSEPPARRIDRYRQPGWSDMAELEYLARHTQHGSRGPGRPRGPFLIQTREEIEQAYRLLWDREGRRPTWRAVAVAMNVEDRTLRRARRDFGLDARAIEHKPE